MRRCCIIGGAGFIGSFVVRSLLDNGRNVIVVGRKEFPTRSLPDDVEYVSGDFGDTSLLHEILQKVDEVIDLAYATVPKTSYENPVQDILENLPPVVHLLDIASQYSLKKILLVSSGGVIYGHTDKTPIDEDQATNPISPYGITKLAVEKYARMFHVTRDLPIVCVRPGNAYGETQKPFSGQGFIATAIASILKESTLELYGEVGTIRDYIHVQDVAEGILAALSNGRPGSVYNIGSGEGRSNRDVLNALCPLAKSQGLEIIVNTRSIRKFDVPVNVLDYSKLNRETGWKAKISFKEGLQRTWDWFQKNYK